VSAPPVVPIAHTTAATGPGLLDRDVPPPIVLLRDGDDAEEQLDDPVRPDAAVPPAALRPDALLGPDRPAPWSEAAEEAVLSATLLDQEAIGRVAKLVELEMFYRERHRLVFAAMLALAARSVAIDPVTVHDELQSRGDLDRIGGMEYLATLIDVVPTAAHVEHHARIIREHALRRDLARAGAVLADLALSREQLAATVHQVQELQQALASTGANGAGLRGFSDREILALPDPTWTVDGLLPRGGLALLVGRWGAGKTFVLVDVSMHVAAGMEWQGRHVQQGPVLYVYGEGAMKLRVAAWRAAHRVADQETIGVTYVPGTVNLLDTPSVAAFVSAVTTERLGPRPVLIVLETLSRMTPGGDENSPETAGLVIAACERIQRETQATVWLSHHTPWNPDQQRPRGHTKLPDAADAAFLLDNDGGALKLTCQKMRDGEAPAPIYLRLTHQDGALVVDRGEAPRPESTDVDGLLVVLGDDALTVADLEHRLGVSERTVMRRLKDAGDRVSKVPGTGVGRRAATYHRRTATPLEGCDGGAATGNGVASLLRHGSAVSATELEPGE